MSVGERRCHVRGHLVESLEVAGLSVESAECGCDGGREQEEEKEPGKTNKLKFLVSSYKNNEVALQQNKQWGKESSLYLPPPQICTNWVQTQVHTESYLYCSNLFWTASVIYFQCVWSLCLRGLELKLLIWWHLLRREISDRLRRLLQLLFGILHQVVLLAAVNLSVSR